MQAVIINGGKQYLVTVGQVLKLEKMPVALGQSVSFAEVLMVSYGDYRSLGNPYVAGCIVEAEVLAHNRHPKIRIIKFKRRKHHMKRMGHRQHYTAVKIVKITL